MEKNEQKEKILTFYAFNVVVFIYPKGQLSKYWSFYKKKETYPNLEVLGNVNSGGLLYNWKFPWVM